MNQLRTVQQNIESSNWSSAIIGAIKNQTRVRSNATEPDSNRTRTALNPRSIYSQTAPSMLSVANRDNIIKSFSSPASFLFDFNDDNLLRHPSFNEQITKEKSSRSITTNKIQMILVCYQTSLTLTEILAHDRHKRVPLKRFVFQPSSLNNRLFIKSINHLATLGSRRPRCRVAQPSFT